MAQEDGVVEIKQLHREESWGHRTIGGDRMAGPGGGKGFRLAITQ